MFRQSEVFEVLRIYLLDINKLIDQVGLQYLLKVASKISKT